MYQEIKIVTGCVELMETKVLSKDVKWKKKNEARKARQKKTKKRCEEGFRSSRVSLPVNASISAALQWGLPFPTVPKRIRPVAELRIIVWNRQLILFRHCESSSITYPRAVFFPVPGPLVMYDTVEVD